MLIHVMLPWFSDIRRQASGGNCIALYLIYSIVLFEQCMHAMGFEPKKYIKYYCQYLYMQLILTNAKWEVCEIINKYNL